MEKSCRPADKVTETSKAPEKLLRTGNPPLNPSSILNWIIRETDKLKVGEENETVEEQKESFQEGVYSLSTMSVSEREKWKDIMLGRDPDVISDVANIREKLAHLSANPDLKKEDLTFILDELNFMVEITPNVTVFMHANGVDILSTHLTSEFSEVREGVALCLTTCVMNNEAFQKHLHDKEVLRTLLGLLESEQCPRVEYKLFSVIGGYFRGFQLGLSELVGLDGFNLLIQRCTKSLDIETKLYSRGCRMLIDMLELDGLSPSCCSQESMNMIARFLKRYFDSSTRPELDPDLLLYFVKTFARKGCRFIKPLLASHLHTTCAYIVLLPGHKFSTAKLLNTIIFLFQACSSVLDKQKPTCQTIALASTKVRSSTGRKKRKGKKSKY